MRGVAALGGVLLLVATGCVSMGRQYENARIPEEKLADVHPGVTTKADVLRIFGAPTTIQRRDIEGLIGSMATRYQGRELTVKLDPALLDDVYVYEYRRVNRLVVFGGFFNWVESVDKTDRLAFFFHPDGRLAGWGFTAGTKEL